MEIVLSNNLLKLFPLFSPNWKCDCNLVYKCDGRSGFPNDFSDPGITGYVKDLAPEDYPLRIPGKRWRQKLRSQEKFCKQECYDRMNAFLCLEDDSTPSDYSYSALCVKLLETKDQPFTQDRSKEPCCEIYLQWGPKWCSKKWYRLVTTVRCLSLGVDSTFDTVSPKDAISNVFSAEGGCDVTTEDFIWCDAIPQCPTDP